MNMKEIALPNPEYVEGDGIHDEAGLLSNYAPCDLYTADQMRAYALAALASDTGERGVPAIDVFRIAGGDVECCPEPTAEQALECLRDLRECYAEALRAQPAGGGAVTEAKYAELLYAVARAFPNESRHETALRYIRQAESQGHGPASAALTQGGGNGR